MKALLMILIFFPGVLSAQVELDLQLCREMAIRNSKEMEIAPEGYVRYQILPGGLFA